MGRRPDSVTAAITLVGYLDRKLAFDPLDLFKPLAEQAPVNKSNVFVGGKGPGTTRSQPPWTYCSWGP